MACELLTPPGNWSSYPPHKHDATDPCEVVNEEIYYYRIAGPDQVTPSEQGFGLHRTYTGAEHDEAGLAPIDLDVEVRDGDVVLVPHGYHGPCVAAPGYPMYYLNVLAGPGQRSMAFCDDPAHAWQRSTWDGAALDPRVPMTSADGLVRSSR
jgi:5-deoxy-glucuronate isomerase